MDTRFAVGLLVLAMVVGAYAQADVALEVEQVIVYPQSVALVYENGAESAGNQFTAEISQMAYLDSIRVSGASELLISTANTPQPYLSSMGTLQKEPVKQLLDQLIGKAVKIGDVQGTLAWIGESWIGISNTSAFIAMPISSAGPIVSATPLSEPNETIDESETKTNVTWLSGGNKNIKVSYLANGFSWTPVYFLDASDASSRFEFWAKVSNSFGDLDANIKLVGGDVKVSGGRYYDTNYYQNTMAQAAMGSAAYDEGYMGSTPSVTTAGEYEIYDLGKKSIKKGESRLISIFDSAVTPEKEYVWDTRSGNYVQRIYMVENPGKTWSYGTVKVYENGMLMGEDAISWTPKGQKAKITIGNAPDIEVSKKTTSVDVGGYSYKSKHSTTLKLKNYKATGVTVKLIDSYPSYINEGSFESSEEFIKTPGNLQEMNVTLSAGQEKLITYSYTT